MSSAKGKIVRLLSAVVLKRGTVTAVQDLGGFQRLAVRCDLSAVPAGTKVQVLLPSDDMRTYTPIAAADGMVLLGWKHASGPGSRWMAGVRAGDGLSFVGPQRSLELDAGPVVLVGDETSVAVAAALAAERPGQVYAILQGEGSRTSAVPPRRSACSKSTWWRAVTRARPSRPSSGSCRRRGMPRSR